MCERANGLRLLLAQAKRHAERMFETRSRLVQEGKDCADCVETLKAVEACLEAARNFVFTGVAMAMPSRLEDFVKQASDALEYQTKHKEVSTDDEALNRLIERNKQLEMRNNFLEAELFKRFGK